MANNKKTIPLSDGGTALQAFLGQYHAEFIRESSTEKGHVYWSAPVGQWILVMKKGENAIITFHHKDNCPCQMI
jgi:hypothetical protein